MGVRELIDFVLLSFITLRVLQPDPTSALCGFVALKMFDDTIVRWQRSSSLGLGESQAERPEPNAFYGELTIYFKPPELRVGMFNR